MMPLPTHEHGVMRGDGFTDKEWETGEMATTEVNTPVRTTALERLRELADVADLIAVAGENRFVNGQHVPYAATVMHAMRDIIRHSLVPEWETDNVA